MHKAKGNARLRLSAAVNAAAPSGKRAWPAMQPCWALSRHLPEQRAVGGRPTVTRYEKAVHAALAKRAAIERALVGQWVEETAADADARLAAAFTSAGAEVSCSPRRAAESAAGGGATPSPPLRIHCHAPQVAKQRNQVLDLALQDYAAAYDASAATRVALRAGPTPPADEAGGDGLRVECAAVRGRLPCLRLPSGSLHGASTRGSGPGPGGADSGHVPLVRGGTDAKTLAPSPTALEEVLSLPRPRAPEQGEAAPVDVAAPTGLRCSEDAVMAELAALYRADAACDLLALERVVAASLPGARPAASGSHQGGAAASAVPCRVVRSKGARQGCGGGADRPRRRRPAQSVRSVFFDAPLPRQGTTTTAAAAAAEAAAAADAVRVLAGVAPAGNSSIPDQPRGGGHAGGRAVLLPGASWAIGSTEGTRDGPQLGAHPPTRPWPPYRDRLPRGERRGEGGTAAASVGAEPLTMRAAYYVFTLGDRRVLVVRVCRPRRAGWGNPPSRPSAATPACKGRGPQADPAGAPPSLQRAPVVGAWGTSGSGEGGEGTPVPEPVAVADPGPLPLLRAASPLQVASLVCRSACAGRAFAPLARLDAQSASVHCLQLVGEAWWRQAGGGAVATALSALLEAAGRARPGESLLLVEPGTLSLLPGAASGTQSPPLASFLSRGAPQSPGPWASAEGVPPLTVLPDGLAGLLPPRPRRRRCGGASHGSDCSCPRLLAGGCNDALHVEGPSMHCGRVVFPVWLLTGADELSEEVGTRQHASGAGLDQGGEEGDGGELRQPGGELHPAAARAEALPRKHEGPVLHCLRCTPLRSFCEAFAMEGGCADAQCTFAHVPEAELARDVMDGTCTVDSSPPVQRRQG